MIFLPRHPPLQPLFAKLLANGGMRRGLELWLVWAREFDGHGPGRTHGAFARPFCDRRILLEEFGREMSSMAKLRIATPAPRTRRSTGDLPPPVFGVTTRS